MTNLAVTDHPSTNARTLLAGIDTLAAVAPAEIRSDFARFVTLEHAVLTAGRGGPQRSQQINNPHTMAALQRVAGYLRNTCGIH